MLAREKHGLLQGMSPAFDRIELRFVKRKIDLSSKGEDLANYTRVLQYRDRYPYINDHKEIAYRAGPWTDVPIVEEDE